MASTCISSSVSTDPRGPPLRATYINLYKWPESDTEFVRSVSSSCRRTGAMNHPKVVDSVSCRQLYLRSYTFSRRESVPERTKKCLGRVRDRVMVGGGQSRKRKSNGSGGGRKCAVIRRAKEVSCAALLSVFRRLLSCTAKVDVVG